MKQYSSPILPSIDKKLKEHPFIVPKYLQNYNIQTLFSRLAPYYKTQMPKKERKYIKLVDGSQTVADCFFQPNKEARPTIIVLDGFTRPNTSHFSRSISHKIYHYGFNVILLMHRAEGGTIKLTKSLFAAYPHLDLSVALEEFFKLGLPNMYLVGFSGGGWGTLLTLGIMGKDVKKYLSGAAVISTAGDLINMWEHVEKYPFYNWYILHTYKKTVKRRANIDPPRTWDLKKLREIKTKRKFFENYYSNHTIGTPEKKVSVEEYNKQMDSVALLSNIQIPTLIINSYDDPVVPVTPFLHITNPNILTLLPRNGGHGGFFTTERSYGDLDGLWAQNRAIEFIRLLEAKK